MIPDQAWEFMVVLLLVLSVVGFAIVFVGLYLFCKGILALTAGNSPTVIEIFGQKISTPSSGLVFLIIGIIPIALAVYAYNQYITT